MGKMTPWVQALCYPLGETSVITKPGFVRSDRLADLSRNPEEAPPEVRLADVTVGGVRLTTPQRALDRGVISNAQNLRWWDLTDNHEGTEVSGYTVQPYLVPRSNRMKDTLFEIPGEQDPLPLAWTAVSGGDLHQIMREVEETGETEALEAIYWETCQPDAEPQTEAIAWRGTDREQRYMARTDLDLPRGQSWAMRLWWLGTAPVYRDADPITVTGPGGTATIDLSYEVTPGVSVQWGGGTWGVDFRVGAPPALCRWHDGEFRRARVFPDFETDLFADHEPMWLRCFNVAGRLIVQIETAGGKRSQVVYTETEPDKYGAPQVVPVQLPRGPMTLAGRGVAFTCQLHEYRFGRWVEAEEDEFGLVTEGHFDSEGSFEREYWCNREVLSEPQQTAAFGYYPNGSPFGRDDLYEGDAGSVADVTDETVADARGRRTGKRRYTCTLTAHNPQLTRDMLEEGNRETSMAGARTPFVYGCSVKVASSSTATSTDPVDIRPALTRVTENLADPMISAGPMWQFSIDRSLLPEAIHQGTGNSIGNAWTDYVDKNHRIDCAVSWTQEDGTVSAGASPHDAADNSHIQRLIGLLTGRSPQSSRFGDYGDTLTAQDYSLLLQAPAGLIDGRFGPLDLLMHEKIADGDRTLMGWEAVQDILATVLGSEIAGDLVHKFPANHHDLLTHRLLLDPPHGGFFFPPPFGSDARQWIGQLAERDFAVFFWAAQWGDPTSLVPHYCNYYTYLSEAPTVELEDAEYVAGETDDLITGARWQHNPREDYNRVVVQGAPPGQGNLGGIMPSLRAFSAEARIEDGSAVPEQNIADTWERTKLMTGSQFWLPHTARVVAINFLRLVKDLDMRGISITVRGNPYLWWGWRVRPRMNAVASDPHGFDLDGQLCRIIRIQNVIDLLRGQYETTLRVAPDPEVS